MLAMQVKDTIPHLEKMLKIYRTLDPELRLTSIDGPDVHVSDFEDFKAILKGREVTCTGDKTIFWKGELNGITYICINNERKLDPEAVVKVQL